MVAIEIEVRLRYSFLWLTIHCFFYLPADIVDLLDHVTHFLFVSLMGIKHVTASIHKLRELL